MTRERRKYYARISDLADKIGCAAQTLASDCRDGDGHRMANPDDVEKLLDTAIENFLTFIGTTPKP